MSGNVNKYWKNLWTEGALFTCVLLIGSGGVIALATWLVNTNVVDALCYYIIVYTGLVASLALAGLCMYKYGMWRINKYNSSK